ncbi:DUF3040 domain-containing protein [Streptomyces sp. MUM 203J]|uniref:DUF3040 domain-containing protein n=1 Tax=Streptomyces sp. MUM 203J TaxID=2791990 RepID=UPI001F046D2E|nr:DUF3040 domain-containing protein [Streptomyces sp. MUM 203J]MCH0540773.1 DUF3040 domain-containing protein [Streptomyces sp. MUM 203J]
MNSGLVGLLPGAPLPLAFPTVLVVPGHRRCAVRRLGPGAVPDERLVDRDRMSRRLRHFPDDITDPWGVRAPLVETRDAEAMRRETARQAEAEPDRRAEAVHTKGEPGAAETLADATRRPERRPETVHPRIPSATAETSPERTAARVSPLPVETLRPGGTLRPQDAAAPVPAAPAQPQSDIGQPRKAAPEVVDMAPGMDEDRLLAEIERSLAREDPALDERMAALARQFTGSPSGSGTDGGDRTGGDAGRPARRERGRRGRRRDWRKVVAVAALVVAVLGMVLTALFTRPAGTPTDQVPPAGMSVVATDARHVL